MNAVEIAGHLGNTANSTLLQWSSGQYSLMGLSGEDSYPCQICVIQSWIAMLSRVLRQVEP